MSTGRPLRRRPVQGRPATLDGTQSEGAAPHPPSCGVLPWTQTSMTGTGRGVNRKFDWAAASLSSPLKTHSSLDSHSESRRQSQGLGVKGSSPFTTLDGTPLSLDSNTVGRRETLTGVQSDWRSRGVGLESGTPNVTPRNVGSLRAPLSRVANQRDKVFSGPLSRQTPTSAATLKEGFEE